MIFHELNFDAAASIYTMAARTWLDGSSPEPPTSATPDSKCSVAGSHRLPAMRTLFYYGVGTLVRSLGDEIFLGLG